MDNNIDNEFNDSLVNNTNNNLEDEFFNADMVIEKKKRNTSGNKKNVRKSKNTNNGNNTTVILIVSILLSFICGSVAAYLIVSNSNVAAQSVVKNITTSELVETSISISVDKVYPATVLITTNKGTGGTGFVYQIVNKKAYIMTNNHVIDGASSFEVEYNDSSDKIKATLVGKDVFSDIAVLTIDEKDSNGKYVELGKSSDLKLGDTVFTVGSPLGINYKGTVTKGIVSGKDRLVDVSLTDEKTVDYYMDVMQVDAALNPGNSGGPLCDVSGKVVGVNVLKIIETPKGETNMWGESQNMSVESMGFAIPIEDAIKYAKDIEQYGKVIRPFVGIGMIEDSKKEYYLRQSGVIIPDDVEIGAVIESVDKNSPADNSKLKKFDIITEIDGKEVSGIADFRYWLYKHKVGDTVELVYYRNGKEEKTKITLSENKNS